MNITTKITQRQASLIAGIGLLVMTVFAIFGNFLAIENLIVPGDAATTANNILSSEGLFRLGICSLIIVAILDVVVAWALYIFLKPVNKNISLLAAIFRIVYAAIFAVTIANLFNVLELLSGDNYLTVFETEELYVQVMIHIASFRNGWDVGIIFFGIHLLILGYLVYKSGFIHKVLGILLVIASLGYLIDAFGVFLIPNYSLSIGMFTFIGELLLMFWLLVKGGKITE